MSMNSTQILLDDLKKYHAPSFIIAKAIREEYNDFLSPSPTPIMDLVHDAFAANLPKIMEYAMEGKYDATKYEADEWMQREGKHLLNPSRKVE